MTAPRPLPSPSDAARYGLGLPVERAERTPCAAFVPLFAGFSGAPPAERDGQAVMTIAAMRSGAGPELAQIDHAVELAQEGAAARAEVRHPHGSCIFCQAPIVESTEERYQGRPGWQRNAVSRCECAEGWSNLDHFGPRGSGSMEAAEVQRKSIARERARSLARRLIGRSDTQQPPTMAAIDEARLLLVRLLADGGAA